MSDKANEDRPLAKNGQPCDCETPGDWHRVASDFQQAMFRERGRADAAEARCSELERERDEQVRINEFDRVVPIQELREELERVERERDEAMRQLRDLMAEQPEERLGGHGA